MNKKITVFFLLLLFLLVGSFFVSNEKILTDGSNFASYGWISLIDRQKLKS